VDARDFWLTIFLMSSEASCIVIFLVTQVASNRICQPRVFFFCVILTNLCFLRYLFNFSRILRFTQPFPRFVLRSSGIPSFSVGRKFFALTDIWWMLAIALRQKRVHPMLQVYSKSPFAHERFATFVTFHWKAFVLPLVHLEFGICCEDFSAVRATEASFYS
jgi:hypothetical protein